MDNYDEPGEASAAWWPRFPPATLRGQELLHSLAAVREAARCCRDWKLIYTARDLERMAFQIERAVKHEMVSPTVDGRSDELEVRGHLSPAPVEMPAPSDVPHVTASGYASRRKTFADRLDMLDQPWPSPQFDD